MNPSAPQNSRACIVLYLEIPDLVMTPWAATCRAELMRAKIRRALLHGAALWREPLSAAESDGVLDAMNLIGGLRKHVPSWSLMARYLPLARRLLSRVISEPGVQCRAFYNWFFIVADVSDEVRGVSIIKNELDRAGLLRFAEIVHFDRETNGARALHPPGCLKSFANHCELVSMMIAYSGLNRISP